MTSANEDNVSDVKRMIKNGKLPHMNEAYKSEDVIMDENGYLHTRRGTPESDFDQKRQELGWVRKNLVLGFNQHEEHTLKQANKIIEMEWEKFKDDHDVSFFDSMKIVVEDII